VVKVKEENIRVMKQEMNLLIDAVTVAEALAEEKIRIEDVNNMNTAGEKANIEMSNNQNVDTTDINDATVTTSGDEINQTENQVTDMQNGTNTEDSASEAINTTEKESTLVAIGTSETKTENSQTSEEVQALEQGSSMILENVLFDYDKSTLRPESYETLDKLVTVMQQPPAKSKVELSGHTDSKGSNDYNQKLAERRAQSVVNYLINKGISKDRLVAKGYGESRPAAPNSQPDGSDNPAGRQLNRRTELKLLKE
jgi:outer membrane protein OmpA-like peptidoglycan-associated protein